MKNQPDVNYKSDDVVYTPRSLAKRIITHFNPSGLVLDPCKGDGAFFDQIYVQEKDWCEVSQGRDFFEYNRRVDWIISNPPYSLFRKFLLHSMDLAKNIVYLITVNHVWTKARMRDIKEKGFGIKEIYCVDTPKNFPPSGFQYGAVHFRKGWKGDIKLTLDEKPQQGRLEI